MSINAPIRRNRIADDSVVYSYPYPSSKRGVAKRRKDKTPGSVPSAFYYNYAGEREMVFTPIRFTWRGITYFSYTQLRRPGHKARQTNYVGQFHVGSLSPYKGSLSNRDIPPIFVYRLERFRCQLPLFV